MAVIFAIVASAVAAWTASRVQPVLLRRRRNGGES